MTGQILADLLLEMDVLNIPDLKREIRKLGAHVSDPLAQRWFMRAAQYWMVNIDRLLSTPYKAVAEPRTIRGAPGYYEPFPRQEVPLSVQTWRESPPPPKKPYRFKTGLECNVCHGAKVTVNPDTGEEKPCEVCKGTGLDPKASAKSSAPKQKVKNRREGHFPESKSLVSYLLSEAEPLNPLEPRDPEGVYTSRLHEPDIEKHIKQNFEPFKPSQAKPLGKTRFGEPPPKERLPSYATGDQEFYHFNPIQARRREFFQRLTSLVHYLNYKHVLRSRALDQTAYATALAGAKELGTESVLGVKREQEEAKKALDFFKWLGGQSPENIEVFRQVMREAEQFGRDIVEKPWLFDKGSEVIAREGEYKIIKVTSGALAMKMSNRPLIPSYKGHTVPGWCTKDSRAEGYIKQGPLYFIDKNDQNYVLVHFETNQAKLPDQSGVTPAIAKTLVPVMLKNSGFANQVRAEPEGELAPLASALSR